MNQEPQAVRILKAIIIGSVVVLIPISFFIEQSVTLKIGHGNVSLSAFEILLLAIPMIGLLFVYECVLGVVLVLKKRKMIASADDAFIARLASRSAPSDRSTHQH
ncbi:MAG: hypothetical protein ABIS50_00875 [Luteolibacter sp.]|uniref:hypothetical protein n=1 Tax=Luteolibacter sp. TaxID=1962973 RepID=UPI003265609B